MSLREIYVPGSENPLDAADIYAQVIASLPLEDCHTERHPLVRRLEFVAPPGMLFEAHGEFSNTLLI